MSLEASKSDRGASDRMITLGTVTRVHPVINDPAVCVYLGSVDTHGGCRQAVTDLPQHFPVVRTPP